MLLPPPDLVSSKVDRTIGEARANRGPLYNRFERHWSISGKVVRSRQVVVCGVLRGRRVGESLPTRGGWEGCRSAAVSKEGPRQCHAVAIDRSGNEAGQLLSDEQNVSFRPRTLVMHREHPFPPPLALCRRPGTSFSFPPSTDGALSSRKQVW